MGRCRWRKKRTKRKTKVNPNWMPVTCLVFQFLRLSAQMLESLITLRNKIFDCSKINNKQKQERKKKYPNQKIQEILKRKKENMCQLQTNISEVITKLNGPQ